MPSHSDGAWCPDTQNSRKPTRQTAREKWTKDLKTLPQTHTNGNQSPRGAHSQPRGDMGYTCRDGC